MVNELRLCRYILSKLLNKKSIGYRYRYRRLWYRVSTILKRKYRYRYRYRSSWYRPISRLNTSSKHVSKISEFFSIQDYIFKIKSDQNRHKTYQLIKLVVMKIYIFTGLA